MRRVLIVLSGAIDRETLRQRCARALDEADALAVCAVLPADSFDLGASLRAQREITTRLRDALGDTAERVTVLVASEQDGYRVEDCARAWDATEVRA